MRAKMDNSMKMRMGYNIRFILRFMAVIWAVYFIGFLPFVHLDFLGVYPRTLAGLPGILFMPFLHSNLVHIVSNSIPLFILLLIAMSYSDTSFLPVIFMIILISGLFTWLFGLSGPPHIGASGLVFGLIGYLVSIGYFERSFKAIVISLLVLFFYGFGILMMLIPVPGISWIGHVSGFVVGVYMAKAHPMYVVVN